MRWNGKVFPPVPASYPELWQEWNCSISSNKFLVTFLVTTNLVTFLVTKNLVRFLVTDQMMLWRSVAALTLFFPPGQ